MTPEHFQHVQIPRIGQQLGPQNGPVDEAYQAANEAYRTVMVGLAKNLVIFLLTVFGATLLIVIGHRLASWSGAFVLVSVIGIIATFVIRSS